VKSELERITKMVLPTKMDNEGISTINVKGIGRITITQQMSTTVKKDDQPELKEWLRENGYGALVTETINASTLKAWIKERIAESEEFPAHLISIYAYEQASLTKL